MSYRFKAHTADVRMQVSGTTLRAVFKDALAGMTALAKPHGRGAPVVRAVAVSAPDSTALLVDFLNEVLLLMLTRREAYTSVAFEQLGNHELTARLTGRKAEGFGNDIKAVTYHEARIECGASGIWSTTIIFDI
ncbi:archease [Patescibacteria group bacterium]|nr:archease [Patescibacteria group bacterium]